MKNVVVIGGGTGSFAILSGLKKLKNINLTAIVPSTDSGGSTGRLKDEFGYLPTGDVRQCLVALAEDENEQTLLRKLFLYRFDKGETGLRGHNFGNLFLTVLQDILGDELSAIKTAQKILNIEGNIYPVSLQNGTLVATYENGVKLFGEHTIDEPPYPHDGRFKITKLSIQPLIKTYPEVENALKEADLIIIGPGDLYTSLIANIIVKGVPEAIQSSKAKVVYIMNLVSKFGQTYNYTAQDFVSELEKYLNKKPDIVLVNKKKLPASMLKKYLSENAHAIKNNLNNNEYTVIETDLLADEEFVKPNGDVLKRSLIRHDGEKVADVIEKLLNQ